MMFKRVISTLLCLGLGVGSVAQAQDYPTKPIKIVVPFTAGGGVDGLARALADKLAAKLGQPVIVDNRPGASGNIAAEYVYKSPLEFMQRLAALVPRPRLHLTRFHGDMTMCVVPSRQGLFSCSTTWPSPLRLSRSLAIPGRVI